MLNRETRNPERETKNSISIQDKKPHLLHFHTGIPLPPFPKRNLPEQKEFTKTRNCVTGKMDHLSLGIFMPFSLLR
jgi:hypothetical protein